MLLIGQMLLHVLSYFDTRLNAVALGRAIVHQNQFVSVALTPEALLDPVDCLVAVRSCVALYTEVHEQALDGHGTECVVVDDKDWLFGVAMVLLIGHDIFDRNDLATVDLISLLFFVLPVITTVNFVSLILFIL